MAAKVITLLTVIVSLVCYSECNAETHHITPNYSIPSCGEPCFTLRDYLKQNTTEQFASNTTVLFLSGVHYLDTNEHVVVRDVKDLSLFGEGNGIGDDVYASSHIFCSDASGFYFQNISGLRIANLSLSFCGQFLPDDLLEESLTVQARSFYAFRPLEQAAVVMGNVHYLEMTGVLIQNSTGYGLLAFNILGESTIKQSTFLFNNFYTLELDTCQNATGTDELFICSGGNVVIAFADLPECPASKLLYSLTVSSSYFAYGVNPVEGTVGSGLTLAFAQTSYGIHVEIEDVTSVGNSAPLGANLAILVYDTVDNTSVVVHNTFSGWSNPFFTPAILSIVSGSVSVGSGLYYAYGSPIPSDFIPTCFPGHKVESDILTISDSQFVGNNGILGGGASLKFVSVRQTDLVFQIRIENCSFRNNVGSPASALFIGQVEPLELTLMTKIVIDNCTFSNNSYPNKELPNSVQQFELDLLNTVQLISIKDITFSNCDFLQNGDTALYAYNTRLRLHGNVTFARNSGLNGGGLALHGNSLMLLTPSTHVSFTENSARYSGGGVGVNSDNYRTLSLCFFQIDDQTNLMKTLGIPITQSLPGSSTPIAINIPQALDIKIVFENNYANVAGSALYGGHVDECIVVSTIHLASYRDSGVLFDQLFHFEGNTTNESSLISSDPNHVCICFDNVPDCHFHLYEVTIYPGQTFEVSVVAFGQRGGSSPGIIYSEFILQKSTAELAPFQTTQQVGKTCTNLSYTVSSRETSLLMLLTVEDSLIEEDPTYVSITFLPCPPGFELKGTPPICGCNSLLESHDIDCDIETQTVHRIPPLWIGKDTEHNHNIEVNLYCPFDYCTVEEIDLNLSNPDTQCAFHRTGVLCGACQSGLSASLGDNQCRKCSNDYIALIIPFTLAGLIIVLVLLSCTCTTVTVGAINGLIFYANIVHFNRGIFFPPGQTNILTVFIAWLNLDLGIPTCFYDGMDSYENTWLQFVFPVYIWAIAGVIILLSHYSSTIAKLIGKHAIPALATLFLLSFAKLLRTIIIAFSFTFIDHSDGSRTTVWFIDGNIKYLQGKHIPLFFVALVVLLFLALPYIFFILLGPFLQTMSSHRGVKWVNKLKPFLDAYQGPYKDKYRYWTGLLLFIRGLLFLIFSFNVVANPTVVLLVIIIAAHALTAVAWYCGGVYKSWPLNILEAVFFLKLSILAAGTFYTTYERGNQAALVYISVSFTLLIFIAIVAYGAYTSLATHFYLKWPKVMTKLWTDTREWFASSNDAPIPQEDSAERNHGNPGHTETELLPIPHEGRPQSFSVVFREPLIEDAIVGHGARRNAHD